MPRTRVFLSCVSAQFKDCRDALATDLRAVGCEVRVQEDFQQGPRTLIERLEEYVAQCDRVVVLIGDAYGSEAAGVAVPALTPPRSYTQWEYFFASGEWLDGSRGGRKDRYVYFASDSFLKAHAVTQTPEEAERQRVFIKQVKASGEHWGQFDSVDSLCRLVLRDGWQMIERPSKPRNLPYESLGLLFKGRDAFMQTLADRLQHESTRAAAIVSKQAVHGLGGVGKTRLAIEYALLHEDDYSALLFVVADTPEALRRNLAALCGPLVLNLPESEATEEEVQVAATVRWLREHPGWFLIFDNVDTPDAAAEVEDLLAQLQGGHVLITSRISDWSGAVESFELDVLGEDDAVAFLLAKSEGRRRASATDEDDARALARELDGLALALEQAGAFISRQRVSIADYLHRWRQRDAKVREWHDERLMKYPRSVAVTWDATVAQLQASALALLQTLCWFAPDAIPRVVLETEAGKDAIGDIEDALAALAGFSLIKWEPSNTAFRIHRLVAEVTRERLPADEREAWLLVALGVVNDYLPTDPPPSDVRSWPRWEPLQTHVAAVIAAAAAAGIGEPTGRLMNGLGTMMMAKSLWAEAEPLFRRAVSIAEQRFGHEHPNVAVHLNGLAHSLQALNRMAEAEPLMRRVLAIDEKGLGAEHHEVAIDLNNLAQLLSDTNRLAEAEPLMRRALAIDEQTWGPEHPTVAIRLHNLSGLLADTNRLNEAEPLMRRALAIAEKNFGRNHPNVAIHLNNMAQLLKAQNRLVEAEVLIRRALVIDEQSLGPEHPNVAIRVSNLADLLFHTKRLTEAEPLMRRALAIDEQKRGSWHPSVAIRLNNLSVLLITTNRLGEAEPMLRRACAIFRRGLGVGHPKTTNAETNYTRLLKAIGKTDSEIQAAIEALGRREE